MTQLASQSTSNPVAVSQYAAIEAALQVNSRQLKTCVRPLKTPKSYLSKVAALPGVSLIKPEERLYLFPNVKNVRNCGYDNVTNWVEDLLQEAHVALVTGGLWCTRTCADELCDRFNDVRKAIERMNDFIEKKRIQHNA